MGTDWIKAAEQLHPRGSSGTPAGGKPKVVWHTTEGANYDAMDDVLTSKQAEPHCLYDPRTDRLGQYFPLNKTARALKTGSGPVSMNRDGLVVIQIEVCAYAADPFTDYWKPGPNFAALLDAIASWNVPDEWPAGKLASHGEDVSRSKDAWAKAGHFGHCNVPYNTHWDPGAINKTELLAAAGQQGGLDDVGLQDEISEWSPDDGTSQEKTTVGKTLNQARGYAEDAYQRVVNLEKKVDQILAKLK